MILLNKKETIKLQEYIRELELKNLLLEVRVNCLETLNESNNRLNKIIRNYLEVDSNGR